MSANVVFIIPCSHFLTILQNVTYMLHKFYAQVKRAMVRLKRYKTIFIKNSIFSLPPFSPSRHTLVFHTMEFSVVLLFCNCHDLLTRIKAYAGQTQVRFWLNIYTARQRKVLLFLDDGKVRFISYPGSRFAANSVIHIL